MTLPSARSAAKACSADAMETIPLPGSGAVTFDGAAKSTDEDTAEHRATPSGHTTLLPSLNIAFVTLVGLIEYG